MKKIKSIYTKLVQSLSSLLYIFIIGFVILSLLSFGHSIITNQELSVLGLKPIYIISGSMEDGNKETEIKKDSVIISKEITDKNISELETGDVVTFNLKNVEGIEGVNDVDVTHRLVEINEETFVTKGDANNVIDSFDTDKSPEGHLSNSRIKYKMIMRNNWISKVINTFRHKPLVFVLYTLSAVMGLVVIYIINSQLYDKDLEIKIKKKTYTDSKVD